MDISENTKNLWYVYWVTSIRLTEQQVLDCHTPEQLDSLVFGDLEDQGHSLPDCFYECYSRNSRKDFKLQRHLTSQVEHRNKMVALAFEKGILKIEPDEALASKKQPERPTKIIRRKPSEPRSPLTAAADSPQPALKRAKKKSLKNMTDEEKRIHRAEINRRYHEKHREERIAKSKMYYEQYKKKKEEVV